MQLVRDWVQEDTGGAVGPETSMDEAPHRSAVRSAPVAWEESTKASLKCEHTTPHSIVVAWILSSDPEPGSLAAETMPWEHVHLDMELPDPAAKVKDGPAAIMFRPVYSGCARTCALSGLKPGTQYVHWVAWGVCVCVLVRELT